MKRSLLNIVNTTERIKTVAKECKRVIFSQISYFSNSLDKAAIEPVNYNALNDAILTKDEQVIDEITESALSNCYIEIEQALEKLVDPKMQSIINGAQILSLLCVTTAVMVASQSINDIRKDLESERISTKSEDEVYNSLVLGVLETIYELCKKRENLTPAMLLN